MMRKYPGPMNGANPDLYKLSVVDEKCLVRIEEKTHVIYQPSPVDKMQSIKPLNIYNAMPGTGPNPWKVILILAELEVPYEIKWIRFGDLKSEPYTLVNPNGRVPAMEDPNTGLTLWESGAIIEYLLATYDKKLRLDYGDDQFHNKWLLRSWLMFQLTGQGPMFGQKTWFTMFHEERPIESVIRRYDNETRRIFGVIETRLSKQRALLHGADDADADAEVWLVGDKCTYADLSFVTWDILLASRVFPDGGFNLEKEFPEVWKWHCNALKRPAVDATIKLREHYMANMEDTAHEITPKRIDT